MLKNIKSIYFSRFIFSFLDEKGKLELIKYNKSLQTNLNINLIIDPISKPIYESTKYHNIYINAVSL